MVRISKIIKPLSFLAVGLLGACSSRLDYDYSPRSRPQRIAPPYGSENSEESDCSGDTTNYPDRWSSGALGAINPQLQNRVRDALVGLKPFALSKNSRGYARGYFAKDAQGLTQIVLLDARKRVSRVATARKLRIESQDRLFVEFDAQLKLYVDRHTHVFLREPAQETLAIDREASTSLKNLTDDIVRDYNQVI